MTWLPLLLQRIGARNAFPNFNFPIKQCRDIYEHPTHPHRGLVTSKYGAYIPSTTNKVPGSL